jgi:Ser-tRNA(Ala) deacylase AlaX
LIVGEKNMEQKKQYYAPMHTAEHILNRTMVNFFNCERSFNSHIERKKSKCDYNLEKQPTEEEIKQVEKKVNEIIQQNLSITEEFISYDEAEKNYKLKVSKDKNKTIRIVRVGEYDACPCIGEHVENTAEIGEFKIISYDYNNQVLRLRFKVYPK